MLHLSFHDMLAHWPGALWAGNFRQVREATGMDDLLRDALEQLTQARKTGKPEALLEALEDVILFCQDERANLPYIDEMERVAREHDSEEDLLLALTYRCDAYQDLEDWPRFRRAAEDFHREVSQRNSESDRANALFYLAEADIGENQLVQARQRLEEAIAQEQIDQQSETREIVKHSGAIRILSIRLGIAQAEGDTQAAALLEQELTRLKARTQEILQRQLTGLGLKPPRPGGVVAVLVALAVGILLAMWGRS